MLHEGVHWYTSVLSFGEHYKASLPDLTEGTEHIQLSTLLFFPSVYQIHIFL